MSMQSSFLALARARLQQAKNSNNNISKFSAPPQQRDVSSSPSSTYSSSSYSSSPSSSSSSSSSSSYYSSSSSSSSSSDGARGVDEWSSNKFDDDHDAADVPPPARAAADTIPAAQYPRDDKNADAKPPQKQQTQNDENVQHLRDATLNIPFDVAFSHDLSIVASCVRLVRGNKNTNRTVSLFRIGGNLLEGSAVVKEMTRLWREKEFNRQLEEKNLLPQANEAIADDGSYSGGGGGGGCGRDDQGVEGQHRSNGNSSCTNNTTSEHAASSSSSRDQSLADNNHNNNNAQPAALAMTLYEQRAAVLAAIPRCPPGLALESLLRHSFRFLVVNVRGSKMALDRAIVADTVCLGGGLERTAGRLPVVRPQQLASSGGFRQRQGGDHDDHDDATVHDDDDDDNQNIHSDNNRQGSGVQLSFPIPVFLSGASEHKAWLVAMTSPGKNINWWFVDPTTFAPPAHIDRLPTQEDLSKEDRASLLGAICVSGRVKENSLLAKRLAKQTHSLRACVPAKLVQVWVKAVLEDAKKKKKKKKKRESREANDDDDDDYSSNSSSSSSSSSCSSRSSSASRSSDGDDDKDDDDDGDKKKKNKTSDETALRSRHPLEHICISGELLTGVPGTRNFSMTEVRLRGAFDSLIRRTKNTNVQRKASTATTTWNAANDDIPLCEVFARNHADADDDDDIPLCELFARNHADADDDDDDGVVDSNRTDGDDDEEDEATPTVPVRRQRRR